MEESGEDLDQDFGVPEEGHAQQPAANYSEMVMRMKQYMTTCVRSGQLLEAENAQIKIEQLKDEEYEVRRSELLTLNEKEMSDLIMQKEEQTQEFNQQWDQHEQELYDQSQQELEIIENKQVENLQRQRKLIENKMTTVYKPSSKLLQFRNQVPRLTQIKRYTEAHQIQNEIVELEVREQQKHQLAIQMRISKHMETFIKHQEVERSVLEKKLINQRNEQMRHRITETEQLKKKFINAEQEMSNRHSLSLSIIDKSFEKTISTRPRFQSGISQSSLTINTTMSMTSFRNTANRSALISARSGRKM